MAAGSIPTPNAYHRALALQHAEVIQARKDVEAQILSSIEVLALDFPSARTIDPSSPSAADIATATTRLQLFQPSDYDDLLTERNASDDRCAYVLCPRPRRQHIPGLAQQSPSSTRQSLHGSGQQQPYQGSRQAQTIHGAGKYTIQRRSGKAVWVDRRELERWCSDLCGVRAAWLRVQLSQVPAWERRAGTAVPICIYEQRNGHQSKQDQDGQNRQHQQGMQDEGQREQQSGLGKNHAGHDEVKGLERAGPMPSTEYNTHAMPMTHDAARIEELEAKMEELALERGQLTSATTSHQIQPIDIHIQDQAVGEAKPPDPAQGDTDSHMEVEGFRAQNRDWTDVVHDKM